MEKVIVIINPASGADLHNVLNGAKGDQPISSDVLQISDRAFLIDLHTSLPFFSGLVHNAHVRNVPCFVFAVEDTLLSPSPDN